MDNEYNQRQKIELERIQAKNILAILGEIRSLSKKLDDTRKELRTVREELRNVGKLRPLRSVEKEEALEPQVVVSDVEKQPAEAQK